MPVQGCKHPDNFSRVPAYGAESRVHSNTVPLNEIVLRDIPQKGIAHRGIGVIEQALVQPLCHAIGLQYRKEPLHQVVMLLAVQYRICLTINLLYLGGRQLPAGLQVLKCEIELLLQFGLRKDVFQDPVEDSSESIQPRVAILSLAVVDRLIKR